MVRRREEDFDGKRNIKRERLVKRALNIKIEIERVGRNGYKQKYKIKDIKTNIYYFCFVSILIRNVFRAFCKSDSKLGVKQKTNLFF